MIVVVLVDVDLGLSQSSYRFVEGQILRNEVCVKVFGDSGECLIPFPIIVYISTIDRTGKPLLCLSCFTKHLHLYTFHLFLSKLT